MGYTHYWTQTRDFTKEEWAQVKEDLDALLKDVQHVQGIPLAWEYDHPTKAPAVTNQHVRFNGIGDDGHETFIVYHKQRPLETWETADHRGWDFCKTARKPYDLAVTAVLCYLATVEPAIYSVSSDGDGRDWLDGLAEARRALPRYANILDIPRPILESDRWCGPWVRTYDDTGFDVHFCVDGHGYIEHLRKAGSSSWFRFETHRDLAAFLDRTKRAEFPRSVKVRFGDHVHDEGKVEPNIWNAMGSFNKERHARIAKAQARAILSVWEDQPADHNPPLYVRPGEMPESATYAYSFEELLKDLAA